MDLNLVSDRTQEDVNLGTDKGFYNASDLNRVENAAKTVQQYLTSNGYPSKIEERSGSVTIEWDENTLLLLHGDSLNDSSYYSRAIENNGITVSTAQSKFGGSSLYFKGNSDLIVEQIPLAGGDFTIDWWEYSTSNSTASRIYTNAVTGMGGILIGYLGTQVYASGDGANWNLIGGVNMIYDTLNQWVHWAFVRSGNTLTSYRNGIKYAETAINGSIYTSPGSMISIGSNGGTDSFYGYIDEFRISNVARWTSDFTPPDSPYEASWEVVETPEWKETDFPTESEMNRYLGNVAYLKNQLGVPDSYFSLPTTINGLTWEGANAIERTLQGIVDFVDKIKEQEIYSGTFFAGEEW